MVLKYGVEVFAANKYSIGVNKRALFRAVCWSVYITHHLITYASGVTGLLRQTTH